MNNIIRNTVDIKTAFLSIVKRNSQAEMIKNLHLDSIPFKSLFDHVVKVDGDERVLPRFWFKKLVRPIATYLYRLLKPVIRPIAFRFRRFLIDGILPTLQRELQGSSIATALQIQQQLQISKEVMLFEQLKQKNELLCLRLDQVEQYAVATLRRTTTNWPTKEILVKTEHGSLLCDASDHALVSSLLDTGELERGTRILIQKYLKPEDTYIDVGANVGVLTLAAARAMQGQGKIIAIEPFEHTILMLEKIVWMNGFSSITEIHQVDTSLVRLDKVIASNQRVDLLKIDAEGAEIEVFEGATTLIVGNPDIALIVEFRHSHLQRIGRTTNQWIASFTQLGLDYRAINQETGALESCSLDALERSQPVNLFFARPESAAWRRLL